MLYKLQWSILTKTWIKTKQKIIYLQGLYTLFFQRIKAKICIFKPFNNLKLNDEVALSYYFKE